MYDLNGNLLGKLAAGDGLLPISFKKLIEANRPKPSARWSHSNDPRNKGAARKGKLSGHKAAGCTVTISKMDGVESPDNR